MTASLFLGALGLGAVVATVRAAAGFVLARVDESRAALAWCVTFAVLAVFPARIGAATGGIRSGALVTAAVLMPFALLGVRRALLGPALGFARSLAPSVVVLTLAALLADVALTTYLWDEGSAHFGVPAAMARGALPAVLPLFPTEPFAYHLGYDVLVAQARAFLALSPEASCDVVTLACIALVLSMLVHTGRALGGERGAALAPAIGLLGYGTFALCLADGWGVGTACSSWFPDAWVSARRLPPPVVSSFFQHPQGLGAPLMLAALLLGLERPGVARFSMASLIIALLSQSQIVMAGLAWGGLGLGGAAHAARTRSHTFAVVVLCASFASLVTTLLFGGLGTSGAALLRFDGGYFTESGLELVAHNAALLGVCLIGPPLSLWLARHEGVDPLRVALAAMVVVAFIMPNIARYERSWDIVKFFAVGALCANVLVADVAARLSTGGRMGRTVAWVLIALSVPSGILWLLRSGPLNGVIAPPYTESPPAEVGKVLDERFGDVIGTALVLSSDASIHQYGFLVAGHAWQNAERGYTFDRDNAERLWELAREARLGLAIDDLHQLGVGFVLLSDRDRARLTPEGVTRLKELEPLGEITVASGRFTLLRVPGA